MKYKFAGFLFLTLCMACNLQDADGVVQSDFISYNGTSHCGYQIPFFKLGDKNWVTIDPETPNRLQRQIERALEENHQINISYIELHPDSVQPEIVALCLISDPPIEAWIRITSVED